jgi:hypothetical protein
LAQLTGAAARVVYIRLITILVINQLVKDLPHCYIPSFVNKAYTKITPGESNKAISPITTRVAFNSEYL